MDTRIRDAGMPQWPEVPGPERRHAETSRSLRWSSAGLTVISRNATGEAFRTSGGMEALRIRGILTITTFIEEEVQV